ncbi:alpha/beta fold hydrolase [Rhodococcus marinonascens]|uniref:alpha/beta fold hydrolase n=1 Tax=Rhodococcus marinonascens TaxID=38311 RepID=UPI0009324FE5|nr:alpha/beta fold hydrolase [Rhodococcus marinonascens]
MITVITCRGIGEPPPSPMLENVTKLLDPERFRVVPLWWRAQYGPVPDPQGVSFDEALRDGRDELLFKIRRSRNPVILVGYSAGAALAGNVAAEIGMGEHPDIDLRGVGLISDPLRDPMNVVNDEAAGFGIAGARHIPKGRFPVWQLADPADVITCCPLDSPLRTFADQSAAFSLADPQAWGSDMIDRLRKKRWQPTIRDWRNIPQVWWAYTQAISDAKGYLTDDHVSYHIRNYPGRNRTYTEWLADRINQIEE